MIVFGQFRGSSVILVLFGLIGFGIQGGFVGMYSIAAKIYPTEIRATGVGGAVGVGRIGAIIGPIVGGVLIGAGFSMAENFIIFAIPTLIGAIAILFVSGNRDFHRQ
jgi:MFS family permease